MKRVLATHKDVDDLIQNEGAKLVTTFLPLHDSGDLSRHSRAANSAVHG